MDASALYPLGFHPVYPHKLRDGTAGPLPLPRAAAKIKYYFVDFGISSLISKDSSNKLVVGNFGRDREVPELSVSTPYDPFKVDVFILGNLFDRGFVEVRGSLNQRRNALTMLVHSGIFQLRIPEAFEPVNEDQRFQTSPNCSGRDDSVVEDTSSYILHTPGMEGTCKE